MNKKITYLRIKQALKIRIINKILKLINFIDNKNFLSIHFRPKEIENIIDDKIKIFEKLGKIGIVIQGPIIFQDNFTLETIKLYKKTFENSEIILSTWKGYTKEKLQKFIDEEIIILENKKPKSGGFINLNYQIISAKNGVIEAEKQNCNYILKTRTDMRIYETGVFEFLVSLLKNYPVRDIKNMQKTRIIGIDINTHKYGIGISDVFQFGTTEELIKMWNIDLYPREITMKQYLDFEKTSSAVDRYNLEFAECYLLKKYCILNNMQIQPNLKSYYNVLKNNFIIIDSSMINMYWNKYPGDEYKGWKNYEKKIANSPLMFKDWLSIYMNDFKVNEQILLQSYEFWKQKRIIDIKNGERYE
ncbi:MAG: WavE lipopolysaccharide synthesis family protein [Cetobacterium sp.]